MKTSEPFSRPDRVAAQIQREIGQMLLLEVRDPIAQQVNVTHVKVTRDLGIARIYYLLIGVASDATEREQARLRRQAGETLERATGFMRRELGQRLRLRLTPKLEFYWDDAVEHGRKMEAVFASLHDEAASAGARPEEEALEAGSVQEVSRDERDGEP